VWAAVQPLLAVFAIYPSRARYVILDFIGSDCTAVVTTDRYAGYAFIDPERRQICWAHLLRDFKRIAQRHGVAGQIGRRLLGLGLVMFRKRDRGQLSGALLDALKRRVWATLQRGAQQERCTRTANTCANIVKLWPALWSFTTQAALAPTNNAAEQALRSLVIKRKISGPTRSLRGDQFLARGFTVHETCLRQGVDLWEFMHQAVHAFIANSAPPSLMPRPASVDVVPTG
jgi:transposase